MELVEEISNNDDFNFYDSSFEDLSTDTSINIEDFADQELDCKWSDSEENEEVCRQEYKLKNNIVWNDNAKKPYTNIKKTKLVIEHTKKLIKTNHKIKISKTYTTGDENIVACVTTMNDIYIFRNFDTKSRTYEIINLMFKITGIEFIDDNRLLVVNDKCKILKVLDIKTFEHYDIKLDKLEFVSKAVVCNKLFVMDNTLKIYNLDNFEIEKIFHDNLIDFCVSSTELIVLKKDKTIVVYDTISFNIFTSKKYVDNYFFRKVFVNNRYNYVLMTKGLRIFDKDWNFIKDVYNLEFRNILVSEEYVALSGDENNCFRMLYSANNRKVKNLPSSSVVLPAINSMFFLGNDVYYTHSSFISKLRVIRK